MPTMNRKIFEAGLSVEAVSLYLLCCALKDADVFVTLKNIREKWNGTEPALLQNIELLEQKNIIRTIATDGDENSAFQLQEAGKWETDT